MQALAFMAALIALFWCGVAASPPTNNPSEIRQKEAGSIFTAAAIGAICAFVAGLLL